MLCELLTSTGVAGRPEEYFEASADTGLPPHPGDFLDGLPRTGAGIRDDGAPPYAPAYSDLRGISDYRHHLERTFTAGTTPNGVFGAKLMWTQIAELQALTASLPEHAGLPPAQLLASVFTDPLYVWIRRRDTPRQAISLWRALQTRTWRLGHGPEDRDTPELHYSFDGIDHLVRKLQADDRAWDAFFTSLGVEPLTIVYEDELVADESAAVARVLGHLGVELPAGWAPAEHTARQSDGLNEAWLAAYHRDAAR